MVTAAELCSKDNANMDWAMQAAVLSTFSRGIWVLQR